MRPDHKKKGNIGESPDEQISVFLWAGEVINGFPRPLHKALSARALP